MQIANISSFAPAAMTPNPVPVSLSPSGSSSSAAALPALPQASASNSSSAVTDRAALSHEIEYVRSLPVQPAQSQGAARSAAADLVLGYSTKVNGTQYSGIVDESGAEYIASVPSLFGATATGASVGVAEINLGFRIDELV